MSTPPASRSRTMRSILGIASTIVAALLAVVLLGDAAVRGRWDVVFQYAPWVLLVVWGVYVGTAASVIRWDPSAISVQNFLRRHCVPWSHITDVTLRYQVRLETDEGLGIALVGGPAAGRPRGRRAEDGSRPTQAIEGFRDEVAEAWVAHRRSPGAAGTVTHGWDWLMICVFFLLTAWAIAALIAC